MSEPTENLLEKRLLELQKKYIDLTMNSKLLEQDRNHWKWQAKMAQREQMGLKHKLELAEKDNKTLQAQVELADYEQVRLENQLKLHRRENKWLKKKAERGKAEIAKERAKVLELEEVIGGFAEVVWRRKEGYVGGSVLVVKHFERELVTVSEVGLTNKGERMGARVVCWVPGLEGVERADPP